MPSRLRNCASFSTPIPKPRATRGKAAAQQSDFLQGEGGQEYNPTETINGIAEGLKVTGDMLEATAVAYENTEAANTDAGNDAATV